MTQLLADDFPLRVDGLYRCAELDYFLYLRFYSDGHVVSATTGAGPNEIESWFTREHALSSHGTVTFEADVLSFSTTGFGRVEYSGTIQSEELHLQSTSSNGHAAQRIYRFVPFGAETEPSPKPAEDESTEVLPIDTMSDTEVLELFEEDAAVAFPYFAGAIVKLSDVEDVSEAELVSVVRNFFQLDTDDRERDARHLMAYCTVMVDALGGQVLDAMGGEMPSLDAVWNFVTPKYLSFRAVGADRYVERRTIYVVLQAAVAWEPEHGLQMCWAGGNELVRVSPFDGHETNGRAFADPARDDFVFASSLPGMSTTHDASI